MDPPLLDPSTIDQLRQVAGDDPSLLDDLFDLFESDALRLIGQLERAVESGEPQAVRQAVHALKGGAANVGAARLAAHCLTLETLARTEQLDRSVELLKTIRDCYAESQVALRREFSQTH